MTSNLGRWTAHSKRESPQLFGWPQSYEIATSWLLDHGTVYDLGCGSGYARRCFPEGSYLGVDGSASRWCDSVQDLVDFKAVPNFPCDSILMRHVLEHDWRWKEILRMAVSSFRDRMALVLFIPPTTNPTTSLWEENPGGGDVPNLQLNIDELLEIVSPFLVTTVEAKEWIFLLSRENR
jgi:hypothetical protein